MRRGLVVPLFIASIPFVVPLGAAEFEDTGLYTINTSTNSTKVGISVSSPDSLSAAVYTTVMLGAYSGSYTIGARAQLNKPASNPYARSAFFDNYTGTNNIPVLRVLNGTGNGGSNSMLSYWNLYSGDFWVAGEIASAVGVRVKGTGVNPLPGVFEPGNDVRSLEETARYAWKHGHLPELPSRRAIRREGVDVGDMNLALIRKVEELTLYLIEQDKRIEKLEHEIRRMRRAEDEQ